MLDVDLGTYPFVTSSNTTAGGAATGTGSARARSIMCSASSRPIRRALGPARFRPSCSTTYGEHLSRVGHEFGSVTGRRRRCGWFDAVALRRSIVHSSVSGLCITKLDVLDGLDTIRICVGYRMGEQVLSEPPMFADAFAEVEPVYEEYPAGVNPPSARPSFEALPANAQAYLRRLESLVGVPLDVISTGPDRDETIMLRHPFDA